MSSNELEEICIGHLFFVDERGPQRLSKNDIRVLREAGNHVLGCDTCTLDEKNKQCPNYMPAKLHIYNVLREEKNPSQ